MLNFKEILENEYKTELKAMYTLAKDYQDAKTLGDELLLRDSISELAKIKHTIIISIIKKYDLRIEKNMTKEGGENYTMPRKLTDIVNTTFDDAIKGDFNDVYTEIKENPDLELVLYNGNSVLICDYLRIEQTVSNIDGAVVIQGDVVKGQISSKDHGEQAVRKAIEDIYKLGYHFRLRNEMRYPEREVSTKTI